MSGLSYYCLQCYKELRPASSIQDQPPEGGRAGGDNCPHCGLQYNPEDEQTFVSFDILSPWASYLLAFMGCLFGGGFFLLSTNSNEGVGWALVLGLPACAGAVLGYSSSPGRFRSWRKVIVALLLGSGFLMMASLLANFFSLGGVGMGIFCLVMLGLVFILPFFFGDWLGYMVRRYDERKQRGWPWKGMKVLLFMLLPFGLDAVERLISRDEDLAVVRTQAVFSSSPERAWNSIVFYEQIEHEPPLLLRLALPRPVGTTGSKAEVGGTSRCVYENGHLVKEITEREEGRLLSFRIIEQKLHFEHDLELREGSFHVESGQGQGTALVTLTTTYRRLTYPAMIWQPVETLVLHTLHEHVLEGMRANAERELADEPGPHVPDVIGRAVEQDAER